MSKHTIWFKEGYNLKVDCIDDSRGKNSGYLTVKVNIDKVRMLNPHCILKVNINCKGCEKKVRKLLLKIRVVDAVSIDAEQEKVTVVGKVDPNELIKQLKKSGKHAEICSVQKGVMHNANGGESNGNNGNGNVNGCKKNGNGSGGKMNGNANANSGENNGNNGNASGGKKNGNANACGGENNGNGNASGGKKNGNGNMAHMAPIGGGGYHHQGMQMQPYSYEQLHHMSMMRMNQQQQQQHVNMYPSMNYMPVPPPPIPSRCMADPTHIFSDENAQSCRIM